MVSTSLTFLRTVPDEQASIYNGYMPQATQIRQNYILSGQGKLEKISALVQSAQSSLADLQQRMNDAEKKIRTALTSQDTTPDAACTDKVRYALGLGLDIPDICQQLVADNDMGGFIALYALLPWLARAGKLPGTRKDTTEIVAAYQKQIMTPQQLALLAEVTECDISMVYMRENFQQLQNFFTIQATPSAVAGMFKRVSSLYRWQGLPNDGTPKGSMTLSDDFDSGRVLSNR